MKRLLYSIFALSIFIFAAPRLCFASSDKVTSSVSIRIVMPERVDLTSEACRKIETKLTQLLSSNGIVNNVPSNRFVITTKANILNKDIISSSPARVSERVEFLFIVGDCIDNKVFETYSIEATGVGLNENKALLMAINAIKNGDPGFARFIETAKIKIVDYYQNNESMIIKNAEHLASQLKFDEAIYYLSMIPEVCNECYIHCQDKMIEIMKEKMDYDGQSNLSKAKAAWSKNPTSEGAENAYPFLIRIDPIASCYGEAKSLMNTISKKLIDDEKRAWDFRIKKYEDEKLREQRDFEARQINLEREAVLRSQSISAARDVAIEYARNQPDVVYYETYNTVLLW